MIKMQRRRYGNAAGTGKRVIHNHFTTLLAQACKVSSLLWSF
jgi:hypothetical protein